MDNNEMQKRSRFEFISLMALLMSMVAFSIDAMLPALDQIGQSLGVADPMPAHLEVTRAERS